MSAPNSVSTPIVLGLPDLCADLLSFYLQFRRGDDPGDADALRRTFDERFRALESRCREAGIPEGNVSLAKYALVALIDETILTSSWTVKESWSGNPLQLEYFNDFAAGEEFYAKLESLRRPTDPGKADVLEVYYLCLALGFKGRHGGIEGMDRIRSLLTEIADELRVARSHNGGRGRKLSPDWESGDPLPAIARKLSLWVITAGCAGLLLVVYIVLSAILGGQANGVLENLP